MHKPKALIIITLLFCSIGYSQTIVNPLEILKADKEFIYGLDNRRTHIKQQNTFIYGAFVGFSLGKNLRYKTCVSGTLFEVGSLVNELGIPRKNRLYFLSIGEEFDFFQIKKFSATTYLQIGVGKNFYRELDENGILMESGSNLIIPFEAGLHFNYSLNTYLKLKTGVGWRFVFPNYSNDLSGYYLKIGVGFNLKKFIELRQTKKAGNTQANSVVFMPPPLHF